MFTSFNSKIILVALAAVIICGGFVLYLTREQANAPAIMEEKIIEEVIIPTDPKVEIIGTSVEKRIIESYTFGSGDKHLLFVGGIHGGYEWNTVILSYYLIDYLTLNPKTVPENIQVTIIPSLNPDGLYKVIGKEGRFETTDIISGVDQSTGRFNANGIDLNRNFACKWKPESSWRGKVVSAGISVFSEPEAKAIQNFVSANSPKAVAFLHSQGNAVYGSECEEGILPETLDIMNAYSKASSYSAIPSFDAYPISGDAEGWLASIGIPAITVELKTHETIEVEQNIAGVKALIQYYSEKES